MPISTFNQIFHCWHFCCKNYKHTFVEKITSFWRKCGLFFNFCASTVSYMCVLPNISILAESSCVSTATRSGALADSIPPLARFVEALFKTSQISTLFQLHMLRPWNYAQHQDAKKFKRRKKWSLRRSLRSLWAGSTHHPVKARASLLNLCQPPAC